MIPHLTFLLGSGISIPAGMPSVKKLTEDIIQEKDWRKDTDGGYSKEKPHYPCTLDRYNNTDGQPKVKQIQDFLKKIGAGMGFEFNYENLYFQSDVFHKNPRELLKHDNYEELEKTLSMFHGSCHGTYDNFTDLTRETCVFIKNVVKNKLFHHPAPIDYLDLFVDACRDPKFGQFNFFTLNHDLLLEECFDNNGQTFIDGFGPPEGETCCWLGELLKCPGKVKLVKLHGSINWIWTDDRNLRKRRLPGDRNMYRDHYSQWKIVYDSLRFLTGTENKIEEYKHYEYACMFKYFQEILSEARHLIVCGYGFGDEGINRQLNEWLNSYPDVKMLVVDKSKDKLSEKPYLERRSLFIEKPIEKLTWSELRSKLSTSTCVN